jgi:hypothetical protein
MFLLIDGFWASGKSVLKSLLDGHPDLKVSPSQEAIFSSFYRNRKNFKKLSYKDLSFIRKILSESYYYDLEKYNSGKHLTVDWGFKVNLDFYKFELFWTKQINDLKRWEFTDIIRIIHTSLIKCYYNIDYSKAKKVIKVFMEDNNFESHFFYLNNFKNSKLILLNRDFGDVIASMINRRKNSKIIHTDNFNKINNYDYLINQKLLCFKNEENKKISNYLKSKFPKRVYICNFENLIFNTENEMKKICNFLKIEYTKILIKNTHFGKVTKRSDKKKNLGKKIFYKEKYLTTSQIKTLNIIEDNYSYENLGIIPIFSSLVLKCKYMIYKAIITTKKKLNYNE